jgi:hypothetical protein
MLARRFLWIIAGIIFLLFACALAYRLFAPQLMRAALVPTIAFEQDPKPAGPDYRLASMWIARPDIPGNPSLWLPNGMQATGTGPAAIFFIHPTSYLQRARWNAPLDDPESQARARLFVQSQASAFNGVGEVWAPKYRQAAVGAFLTGRPDAGRALDFAYRDVLAAFDAFVKQVPAKQPIILAAHSQGSLHLSRLLIDRIAGKPIAKRIVAAYVVGWPLSTKLDLPRLGLPPCSKAGEAGCILAWQSFGEPADPRQVTDIYDASTGPRGVSRAGTPMLCVNPLTGNAGDAAPASANLGTLFPDLALTTADLRKGAVGAHCDARGFLLLGEDPPNLGPYALPGNNYHVFDYALFWTNIRADAQARLASFLAR